MNFQSLPNKKTKRKKINGEKKEKKEEKIDHNGTTYIFSLNKPDPREIDLKLYITIRDNFILIPPTRI